MANNSSTTARSMQNKARSLTKSQPPSSSSSTRARRRRRNRNGNRKNPPRFVISSCARDFAQVRLDPFGYRGIMPPCIPDFLDIPSQKLSTLIRGVAATGTTGLGFLLASAQSPFSDKVRAVVSLSTYTSSALPVTTNITGTGIVTDMTPWEFASNAYPDYRVVGTAARVRYTGTELNRGGRIITYSYNAPTGFGPTFVSINGLSLRPEAQVYPVNREWVTVSWNPAFPQAYSYDGTAACLDLPTGKMANTALYILWDSSPGNTFEFEILSYYEAISKDGLAITAPTKSHCDPVGFGVVKDFLASEDVREVGHSVFQKFLNWSTGAAMAASTSYFSSQRVPLIEYV